ncbi:hypothetical protein KC19_3G140300 [Ceratodon purpureus]|uniref:Uncharacterized protein n=1 Tax=Ceratodon purpureus TaxID=3225 RepID=A0A8T0ILN5_CERPU|nr:hypothetical protein KC19_3G140300 [Ceratodon purpureus]
MLPARFRWWRSEYLFCDEAAQHVTTSLADLPLSMQESRLLESPCTLHPQSRLKTNRSSYAFPLICIYKQDIKCQLSMSRHLPGMPSKSQMSTGSLESLKAPSKPPRNDSPEVPQDNHWHDGSTGSCPQGPRDARDVVKWYFLFLKRNQILCLVK